MLALILAAPALSITSARGQDSISVVWKTPINPPNRIAMSTGGKYCGSVDKNGAVRLFDSEGRLLWEKHVEGATDVLIARDAGTLLVYSRLNPVYREVHFFRRDGALVWKHKLDAGIWSGAISADGRYAAITTGDRYVYLYQPESRPRYRRYRTEGIGYHVSFTPDSKQMIIGEWQDSALACYELSGRVRWRVKHDVPHQYDIQVSADSRTILGLLPASQHKPGFEVAFWDMEGNQVWKQELNGFDPIALICPQSQFVAVSYADFISREGSHLTERKVAGYKADGQLSWEKGGLFFGPRLIALSPTGSSVIVTDGERSLFNIDRGGRILSRMTLRASVRETVPSSDGRSVLLYCGDGWLYMLRLE